MRSDRFLVQARRYFLHLILIHILFSRLNIGLGSGLNFAPDA
jgi:hypothetical protein